VNVETRCKGETPLRVAVRSNRTSAVEILVVAGASVDGTDENGLTPFMSAAWVGNVKMLRFLKDAGSWLDSVDKYGLNPLHLAALSENPAVVKQRLKWNVIDVNSVDGAGLTPLYGAAQGKSTAVVRMLVEAGADVNAIKTNATRFSVVQGAVVFGHDSPEMLKALIDAGADLTVKNNGKSLLVLAAEAGRWKMADLLMSPAYKTTWSKLDLEQVRGTWRVQATPPPDTRRRGYDRLDL
jgi:ankyrin repeat protein